MSHTELRTDHPHWTSAPANRETQFEDVPVLVQARRALQFVEDIGEAAAEDPLRAIAAGGVGKHQLAYIQHASALALVSIAESLEKLAARR